MRLHQILFYSCWLVLSLIQAGNTQLIYDESYYWVYSRFPAWGYFDHPPMIAMMIKGGYAIFQNELGVRLFPALCSTAALFFIERLTTRKDPMLFYGIVLSVAALHLSGFAAVPDVPLVFFVSLFLLVYKKFIDNKTVGLSILLGVIAALMMYTKYHAVLVFFLIAISNPKLFRTYHLYLAGVIAAILFLPHLMWQYEHDWISFRYHLLQSNTEKYKLNFTTEYIIGQLTLYGPLVGLILLPAAFFKKPDNKFEFSLKFLLIGIFLFFLLSSFRGKVEANWTVPVLPALLILAHAFLYENMKWRKIFTYLVIPSILLVFIGRAAMMFDFLPIRYAKKNYHAWKDWPAEMNKLTNGLPVVVNNSYQRASAYWFYGKQMTYSLNHYKDRTNNFPFWPIEDSLLGKSVYIMDVYPLANASDSFETPISRVYLKYDPAFVSFAKIRFEITHFEKRKNLRFRYFAKIPDQHYYNFASDTTLQSRVFISVFNKNGWVKDLHLPESVAEAIQKINEADIDASLPPGKYRVAINIQVRDHLPTRNSEFYNVEIY